MRLVLGVDGAEHLVGVAGSDEQAGDGGDEELKDHPWMVE